ncbi:cytochrome c maturation protein CcmE [Imperialibacter roseus]|mgnify:CR=1 FL=1|uniref:Cytochrome c maturation protein CcmE n=1 Tax=Imperialibacter roseus TaxID=1324217 RepID=A0ABZ0IMJ4_9BACT|nr:cytochrome c maturation protein CcmE [Imperialibacter roseus]WOK06257.1 cytochrome c maturation protein CcmE [Imperialibacter roseus]|tara:strand:+ start:4067 stop:4483 length:417 start_codon:yes stop_codon:yes gene_type:complete
MKKSHIFGIIIIAVAVMVIVSTAGDASTYVSFGEAQELAEKGNANMIHVVGALKKDEQGQPVGIQTSPDMLSFSFIMVDQNNLEQEVIYNQPMPMDFLRSEQVVVVGSYKKNKFIADKILMKCPSKYQENEIKVGEVR